jgi:hypothetical protein
MAPISKTTDVKYTNELTIRGTLREVLEVVEVAGIVEVAGVVEVAKAVEVVEVVRVAKSCRCC